MPTETPTRPNFKEWLSQQMTKIGSAEERARKLKAWTDDVTHLHTNALNWIREADDTHTLLIETAWNEISEEDLGTYKVPALRITLGDRYADLVPVARQVIGKVGRLKTLGIPIEGMVDLKAPGQTLHLFLVRDEITADKKWILSPDDENYQPFTKENYLEAIQDLLS